MNTQQKKLPMYLIFVNRQEGSQSPQDLCRRVGLVKMVQCIKGQAWGPEFDPRVKHNERTNSQNLSSDLHNLAVTHPYHNHIYTQNKNKYNFFQKLELHISFSHEKNVATDY